jgi:demethylmenaquinone methyltransferase/2-methoxy-6-polyprenyl-1,4-benzoquinol methylase
MIEEAPEEPSADFGFRKVAATDKQRLINDLFARVAQQYDQMNDLMSAGLHRLWKDDLVAMLNAPRGPTKCEVLDVAGGTGDVAFRILKSGGSGTRVTIADASAEMLTQGKRRADELGLKERTSFAVANAEALAFGDKDFDAYTIAFGLRNVTHMHRALKEAYRVLKPGGRFLCLEFSQVEMPGLKQLYELYSFTAIPAMGKAVTGDGQPYRYLVESIRRFPDQGQLAHHIEQAGFGRVRFRGLSGGIVAIHSAWRL